MAEETKQLSWAALAEKVGHTRQALSIWSRRPDAPTTRDVNEWKAFIAANDLGIKTNPGVTASELRDEKLRWEIEILKAKDAREKRKVIDREEVNRMLHDTSTHARTLLYQFMETEAPPKFDGMSAAQMRPLLREMADSIAGYMSNAFEKFTSE